MKAGSENESKKDGSSNLDRRFNQTLKSVQGLLRGRSFPGKVLLSRRAESVVDSSRTLGPASTSNGKDGENDGIIEDSVFSKADDDETNVSNLSRDKSGSSGSSSNDDTGKGSLPTRPLRLSSGGRSTDSARVARFKKELSASVVDLDVLRELAWSGVPPDMRPVVWRLLLGYAPPNADRREAVLMRKRQEYMDCVTQYYDIPDAERTEDEIHTLRQISVDCPRTVPDVPFFHQPVIQASLERILYIWAIRHPASGYVQGINDLATPFLVVFLSEHEEGEMEDWVVSKLPPGKLSNVEADCYWSLSKLLDEPVARHMEEQCLEFLQFAFRWVNCLLIREIPFLLVTRLWDTYLAEGDSFPDYLAYVCASFLLTWSGQLQNLDFQEMVLFLQHVPTRRWTHQELEMVLSRAFMWRVMFDRSPSHLHSR
eukprot:c28156_g1_i2 orf=388-1668(+)